MVTTKVTLLLKTHENYPNNKFAKTDREVLLLSPDLKGLEETSGREPSLGGRIYGIRETYERPESRSSFWRENELVPW